MNLLEIKLENPIVFDEVMRLRSELIFAKKHDFLIINLGSSDAVPNEIIKHFKDQLSDLEPCLTKFKKIALIHAPLHEIECSSPHRYHLCKSKEEAIKWLLS